MDPSSLSLTSLILHISKSLASSNQSQDANDPSNSNSNADSNPLIDSISLAQARSRQLDLISTNDSLKEISTSSLRTLFLNSLAGHAWNGKRGPKDDHLSGYQDRKKNLLHSQIQYEEFLSKISSLSILSPSLKSLIQAQSGPISSTSSSSSSNFNSILEDESNASTSDSSIPKMDKRSLKITLFKTERSLTTELENFRKSYREKYEKRKRIKVQDPIEEVFFDFLILKDGGGGGQSSSSEDRQDSDEDDEEEESTSSSSSSSNNTSSSSPRNLRSYLLLLLNLHGLKSSNSLESISQELSLLNSMPSASEMEARRNNELDQREKARNRYRGENGDDDDEWRLTRSVASQDGALMDKDGKPLRPFTITSSNSNSSKATNGNGNGNGGFKVETSKREQLRNQVFQNGNRLPTMSIDEYLEEEKRRGNILTGGGPEGAAKATPREARAIRAENDGTREGYEAEEEARKEAIEWDNFTEENRKGEGNTMNRG